MIQELKLMHIEAIAIQDSYTRGTTQGQQKERFSLRGKNNNFIEELGFEQALKDRWNFKQSFWTNYFKSKSVLLQDGIRNPGDSRSL